MRSAKAIRRFIPQSIGRPPLRRSNGAYSTCLLRKKPPVWWQVNDLGEGHGQSRGRVATNVGKTGRHALRYASSGMCQLRQMRGRMEGTAAAARGGVGRGRAGVATEAGVRGPHGRSASLLVNVVTEPKRTKTRLHLLQTISNHRWCSTDPSPAVGARGASPSQARSCCAAWRLGPGGL